MPSVDFLWQTATAQRGQIHGISLGVGQGETHPAGSTGNEKGKAQVVGGQLFGRFVVFLMMF